MAPKKAAKKAAVKPVAKADAKAKATQVAAEAKAKAKALAQPVDEAPEAEEGDGGRIKASRGDALGWQDIQPGKSMGQRGAQAVKDHLAMMAKCGNPGPQKHYEALKSRTEKRDFALSLKLDRSASFLQVVEQHSASSIKRQTDMEGWITDAQVAIHEGLPNWSSDDSQGHRLQDILEGLDSKPDPRPHMAAKGYKVYYYSKKELDSHVQERKESMTAKATADVEDQATFDTMISSIGESSSTGPKKQRKVVAIKDTTIDQPNVSPEEKAKMEWVKKAQNFQRSVISDMTLLMRLKVKASTMNEDDLPPNLLVKLDQYPTRLQEMNQRMTEILVLSMNEDASLDFGTKYQQQIDDMKDTMTQITDAKNMATKLMLK